MAGDNDSGLCGPCESAQREQPASPPAVPPEFWETDERQAALATRHMGLVVRAYRRHRYHGIHGLSQETVGRWAFTTQGAISRLELGSPPADLNRLIYWARLLRIPPQYLWFKLPEHGDPEAVTEPQQALPDPAGTTASRLLAHPDSDETAARLTSEAAEADARRAMLERSLAAIVEEAQDVRVRLAAAEADVARWTDSATEAADRLQALDAAVANGEPGQCYSCGQPLATSYVRHLRADLQTQLDKATTLMRDAQAAVTAANKHRDELLARHQRIAAENNLPPAAIDIDITAAQTARMGDYLLGGKAHFSVDRAVTDYVTEPLPGGRDGAREAVLATRTFQDRVVRYLAGEVGIRQFATLANVIPPGNAIHEVVQEVAPDSRVVYVISDDSAMAHAHLLNDGAADAFPAYIRIRGSVRSAKTLVDRMSEILDFTRPVGLLTYAALQLIVDNREAHDAMATLVDALPSGSYVMITHLGRDLLGDALAPATGWYLQMVKESKMPSVRARDHAQVSRFMDGLELVGPGVVPVDQWRPDEAAPATATGSTTFFYGAVGRKP